MVELPTVEASTVLHCGGESLAAAAPAAQIRKSAKAHSMSMSQYATRQRGMRQGQPLEQLPPLGELQHWTEEASS